MAIVFFLYIIFDDGRPQLLNVVIILYMKKKHITALSVYMNIRYRHVGRMYNIR
jgi:hypothetical protein